MATCSALHLLSLNLYSLRRLLPRNLFARPKLNNSSHSRSSNNNVVLLLVPVAHPM